MTADLDALLPKIMDLLLDPVCVVDADGHYVFVSAACERLLGYRQEELIGTSMIELVHPDDRERTLAAAAQIILGHPQMNFENRYVRKDGRVVHIMWSARWSEADRLRLAVGRDVTALKRAQGMQSALYRISEAAHAADGLEALYREVHEVIGELLPADNFHVVLYDAPSATLSYPYFVDQREMTPEPRPPDPDTPIAKVIHAGRALLTTRGTSPDSGAEAATGAGGADWLGVPLIFQGGVMGALVVQDHSGAVRYTEDDMDLLQFVSIQVATAIERKQAETRLHHMAHHDALTGLPNRILFRDRFDVALRRARRDCERLVLLYLDLDDFKQVNDTHGHAAGDRLLREVSMRLAQCVRESDTVGRMGGDEFTVLLTNVHGSEVADVVMGKIRAAIGAPLELDGHTLTASTSIGIAVYPEDGDDSESLFHHADAGMYAAKRSEDRVWREGTDR